MRKESPPPPPFLAGHCKGQPLSQGFHDISSSAPETTATHFIDMACNNITEIQIDEFQLDG
ncbi:hypothetical protein IE53DRAFT_77662 [Violaceomyces palustris]|uniref:Uncharacterized protein n=1 Tax=Violaceomyces palustris TaxID=1673888 RepID=A0ACD0NYA4_9BASI|nr:hypothetical protein IE53DRAFT_77662 [Violaceomyces palustris]